MARPINPNSARQQRLREAQARQRLHGPSPKPKLATDNGRLVIPPGLVEAIQANARDRRRTRAENPDLNPFRFDPKRLHPPGSLPPREVQLAMDSAIGWAGEQWANGGPLGQVFAEGLAFPGYPYLSELAQRPEYRTAADIISTEMTRKWIKFSGKGTAHQQRQRDRKMAEDFGLPDPHPDEQEADEEPDTSEKQEKISQLEEFLDNLNCRGAYRLLEATDCYFGRAHLFHEIGGNDGSKPDGRDELINDIGIGTGDISRSKVGRDNPLTRLTNVEPLWIYPTTYNAMNPLVRDFYNPSIWYMQGIPVHCSRMFTQIGRPVPDLLKPAYSFGGLSLTQIMQPYVNIWLETRESIGTLIHAFSVMVLMTDMQTTMQPGGAQLMERVNLFNTLRDNNGTFVLNKATEDFKNVSVPLSGLHELQAQSQEHLASIIRVPVAIYTGISPTGLNASSEGEIRIFENAIHAAQEGRYRQNLTKTVNFAQLSLWDEIDPDITFEFVQLRELTEKEEAELRKMDAETDDILINGCQALSPEEVRIRIAGDENGPHAGIDPDDMPEPPQPPPGEGGPPGAEGDGGEQPGEQPAPGEPKPGGRINISGREAYTGVGGDENPFGSTSDDGGGTGGVGPGSSGPTGGTFASLAEPDPNAALHPGYATGPLTGVNPAKKKQAHDAEWKEGDHPRAPDGKFGHGGGGAGGEGAGEHGEASGFAASPISSEAVRDYATKVAKDLGFNMAKVAVSSESKTFVLNGKTMHYAGSCTLASGDVTLYTPHLSEASVRGVMAHEVEHAKFQAALDAYEKESEALRKDPGPPPNPEGKYYWEKLGGIDGIMTPDGALREPYDKKYPVYQAMQKTLWGPGSFELGKSDGVSDYSFEYWKGFKAGTVSFNLAVHETLAEIARIKYETGKFPEHVGERILSYRGEDVPKPTKATVAAGAKMWRDLFRTVDDVWKERK